MRLIRAVVAVAAVVGAAACGPEQSIDQPCEDDANCTPPTRCFESPPGGHLLFCELHCTSDGDCAAALDTSYFCLDPVLFVGNASDGFCHNNQGF